MSKQAILIFLAAVAATSLVIFGLILPAYYNIDRLGWGAKLGINGMVNQFKQNDATGIPPQPKPIQPSAPQAQNDDPFAQRQNTFELTIPPKQSLDYRLKMERDFELDYFWKTDGKTLNAELRGEPDGGKQGESKTFGKPLLGNAGKGFFIAPFHGKFGWHWVNKSKQEVKIRVSAKGMYQIIKQLGNPAPK